ncbi:MAG: sulfatase [Cyclobacteriaceae bacterium]
MKSYLEFSGRIICGFTFIVLMSITGCSNKTEDSNQAAHVRNEQVQGSEKPNIIFFISDDQDIYDYGCYGNDKVHTPSVDRLAKEGMLFSNAFTSQAICAPSRSQLLTGLYPIKNGCFANHTSVRPNIQSMTTKMQALGYEVVLAGKSHVKPPEVFEWDREWAAVEKAGVPRKYLPMNSIEDYFKKSDRPFVMLMASYYPHSEYFKVDSASAEDIKFFPFNEHQKSNKSFILTKAGYYRSIEEEDTQLERVLEMVDTHLDNNTLFIYSADHGVSGKFTVKDVGLRVPLVARWPGVIEPGSTSKQLVHYVDILPTFIDIAGGEPSSDLDGKSILPIISGQESPVHEYVFGVRTNQNILVSEVFPSRMIRDIRYKYIRNFNSLEVIDQNLTGKANVDYFIQRGADAFNNEPFEELYDLESDPFEQHNLINDPTLDHIKMRLKTELFKWMKGQNDFLSEEPGNMPLITAKGKKGFKLDQDTRRRTIPDSLKNTLKEEDYLIIKHW